MVATTGTAWAIRRKTDGLYARIEDPLDRRIEWTDDTDLAGQWDDRTVMLETLVPYGLAVNLTDPDGDDEWKVDVADGYETATIDWDEDPQPDEADRIARDELGVDW